ncbi:hypothetical protein ACLB2K_012696 [Fragaria x ananassa]
MDSFDHGGAGWIEWCNSGDRSEGGPWSFQDPLVLIDFIGWCVNDENNIDRDVCSPQYLHMGDEIGGVWLSGSLQEPPIGGDRLGGVWKPGDSFYPSRDQWVLIAGVCFHRVSTTTATVATASAWAGIDDSKAWSGMTPRVSLLTPLFGLGSRNGEIRSRLLFGYADDEYVAGSSHSVRKRVRRDSPWEGQGQQYEYDGLEEEYQKMMMMKYQNIKNIYEEELRYQEDEEYLGHDLGGYQYDDEEQGYAEENGDDEDVHIEYEEERPNYEPISDEPINVTLNDPRAFDCPICFEPLTIPVFQCDDNGHIACCNCSSKINRCPSCCSPFLALVVVVPLRRNLNKHFETNHVGSATRFSYNRDFPITLKKNEKFIVFQERNEGTFILKNRLIEGVENAVRLTFLQPSFLKRESFYELGASTNGGNLRLLSYTKSSPNHVYDGSPSMANFLLIPVDFFRSSDQLRMNLCISPNGDLSPIY